MAQFWDGCRYFAKTLSSGERRRVRGVIGRVAYVDGVLPALDQTFISGETEEYTEKYDAALILANVSDFAQQVALRIKWSMPMGPEMPWYAAEVPTVFVSLNMPNHLIDVPMVKTAINAHTPTKETVQALVAKLVGRSEFTGTYNENVWCDS